MKGWGQGRRGEGKREEVQMALAMGRCVVGKEAGEGHYGIYVLNDLSGRRCHLLKLSLVFLSGGLKEDSESLE